MMNSQRLEDDAVSRHANAIAGMSKDDAQLYYDRVIADYVEMSEEYVSLDILESIENVARRVLTIINNLPESYEE